MRIECPVPECPGQVVTKRFETFGVAMICDGPEAHTDTVIRNAFQRWDDELDAIDPDSMDVLLRRANPVEFLKDQVYAAGKERIGKVGVPSKAMLVPPPSFPTGLGGVQNGRLLEYRGMTILSGKPSSGKTWSAIRSSADAAKQGWDVVYIAAEAVAVVHHRVNEVLGNDERPSNWTLRFIEYGTPFESVIEFMGDAIRTERTLFVIDSFSTLMRMTMGRVDDEWAHQRRVESLLFNIRQNTAGCVALLVLSEANAAGETKGRSFDHIADLSVNFRKDEEDPETKHVEVAKAWWSRMGKVGQFVVKPHQGGLIRIPDDGATVADQQGYAFAVGGDTF